MKRLFWVCFFAATTLYLIMVLWSLPLISAAAGGDIPFDMRPMGYSGEDAREFLTALSDEGRLFYLGTQHVLDSIYPGLLGVTLALGLMLLFRGWVAALGVLLSAGVAAADYLENRAVAAMLQLGPREVSDAMAEAASGWTVLKSGLSTVVFLALFIGAFRVVWRRWMG